MPPFGWDVFFYYCSSHEGIGNWELVSPSVCVSVIMRLNKCKLTREHMEVLQAVQADRNFAGLVFCSSCVFILNFVCVPREVSEVIVAQTQGAHL